MAGKKGAGENSKKAQGQARKAEQANKKAAVEDAKVAAAEDADWEKGAKKGNAKKASSEEKKAEAARKKAEREALLAEEEKTLPSRAAPKNAKTAVKKTKGIDQALVDVDGPLSELNATGIENALDALGLTESKASFKIEKHPEKRRKAGRMAFEARVEQELRDEGVWDKMKAERNSIKKHMDKEWKRAPENPDNQLSAKMNATREELAEIEAREKAAIEQRLT